MAEAHSAVAFSFQVNHDGVSVSFNHELLRNIWNSTKHGFKRRVGQFKTQCKAGVYPASHYSLTCFIVLFSVLRCFGASGGYFGIEGFKYYVYNWMPRSLAVFMSVLTWSVLVWLVYAQTLRQVIKLLLSYKGFMFEPRGKVSLVTKIWSILVRAVALKRPLLYSYQGTLPRLPLPSLHNTLERYLRSVRPLCTDLEYNRIVELKDHFENGKGKSFQRYLMLKAWSSTNYVTDWWEEYVYLRGRSPIMVNSNYYGLDTPFMHESKVQAARAANIVHACLQFRRSIHRQELKPIIQAGVPLCSYQYERLFNCTRIPGVEADFLRRYSISNHIAVHSKGVWYRFPIHTNLRLLEPVELEFNFQLILDGNGEAYEPTEGESKLSALTAGSRTPWGKARKDFFNEGLNGNSLRVIESAGFVVILTEAEQDYDANDPSRLDDWAASVLRGTGKDIWYDKSFNLLVTPNGRIGCNAEHSWADAPVCSHLFEYNKVYSRQVLGYKEDGHCNGQLNPERLPPSPERLKWEISDQCLEVINSQYQEAIELGQNVDLRLLMFDGYGKGFIKKQGVSPDAYIQMCLQITYFKLEQKFGLTYEASMTRLFREGRTETVRSVTQQSCDFVRAMLDSDKTDEERLCLLKAASEAHAHLYRMAMCGQGIDRHLFALYVVSRYLEVESPFLKQLISEPWLLSTSQTPHQQTELADVSKHAEYVSAGGGFGPVSNDGYGVSYIVGGEDVISFHISCKNSCSHTNSSKFRSTLHETLMEVKKMCENGKSSMKGKSAKSKEVADGNA